MVAHILDWAPSEGHHLRVPEGIGCILAGAVVGERRIDLEDLEVAHNLGSGVLRRAELGGSHPGWGRDSLEDIGLQDTGCLAEAGIDLPEDTGFPGEEDSLAGDVVLVEDIDHLVVVDIGPEGDIVAVVGHIGRDNPADRMDTTYASSC